MGPFIERHLYRQRRRPLSLSLALFCRTLAPFWSVDQPFIDSLFLFWVALFSSGRCRSAHSPHTVRCSMTNGAGHRNVIRRRSTTLFAPNRATQSPSTPPRARFSKFLRQNNHHHLQLPFPVPFCVFIGVAFVFYYRYSIRAFYHLNIVLYRRSPTGYQRKTIQRSSLDRDCQRPFREIRLALLVRHISFSLYVFIPY